MNSETTRGAGGQGSRRRSGGVPDFSTGTTTGSPKAALVHLALAAWRAGRLDPRCLSEVRGRRVDEAGLRRALYRSSVGESAKTLLEELRERVVRLQADGLALHMDAPAKVLTEELRAALREHKRALIRYVERERRRVEEASGGLVVKWSREPGWISLHDPTTGEWHEVEASECPPSVVGSARAHRGRRGRGRRTEGQT